MAIETKCQTPDAHFTTEIEPNEISVKIALPFNLSITEEQAELLEVNIHNALELCLIPYWQAAEARKRALGQSLDQTGHHRMQCG